MNTLFITVSIIILVIIVIVQYANICRLNYTITELKEAKTLAEVQTHDIIKVTKAVLEPIFRETGILPDNRIPIVRVNQALTPGYMEENLESIRLRLKDGKVLVYINGMINPTKDIVKLTNITRLNDEHLLLVASLISKLWKIDSTPAIPLTPQKIENMLTYNKQ